MDIQIATSEKRIFSAVEGKSILDSALDAGLVFEYSCKTGQCGVCKTTLLNGEIVEIQDQIALKQEDKEDSNILTCCCAPKTDILIDASDLSALHGVETKTLPARISTIKKHTSEIIEVTLRLPPTATFKFLEGQFLDVIYNNIRRSYSIASTSSQKEITLLIKRFENGKMSDYWFNQAKENDLLRIEGPKGTFFLRDTSGSLVFLATGTGIAPIISILESLDTNEDFKQEQDISVYWGNRYPEDFFWQPTFERLKIDFVKVCSKQHEIWNGETGYVQNVILAKYSDLAGFTVYACGSNDMIRSAKQQFIKAGLSEKQFYSDAFVQSF
uniref:Oxidoreductase with ferredoxin and FAD/NAD-binding domains n=1 Tax=Hydrogenovibrio crunogenus (strain DSM 25203 / XCL-2) TaxID=317025 RepID=Q31EZ0_HYDCU